MARLKEAFQHYSDSDWKSYSYDCGIDKTDSFEEFVLDILKSSRFNQEIEICEDLKEDSEEESPESDALSELKSELKEKSEIIVKLEEGIKKAQYEYQICRNSMEKELSRQRLTANTDLLRSLIPVFDDIQITFENKASDSFADGMEIVINRLFRVLGKNGFFGIELSDYFDISTCEAIGEIPGEEEGKIAQVIQRGYVLNEIILRPAKVVVYRKEEKNE